MIRVGQMMMAKVLQLHDSVEDSLHLSFIGEEKFNDANKNLVKIIKQFLDGEPDGNLAPYSIHQICNIASENYGLDPGEWFKSNAISYCLDSCHELFGKMINPGLKLCVFPESIIFLDQIKEKAFEKKYSFIRRSTISSISPASKFENIEKISSQFEECKSEEPFQNRLMENSLLKNEWENSVLVIISIRLGMKNLEQRFFPMIKELLDIKFSVGIMGGTSGKALYIVGYQEDYFIVLDPHYVQVTKLQ